jgi:hypothetical protein
MIGNVIAEAGDIGDGIYRIVQEIDDEERLVPVHVACLNKVSADVQMYCVSWPPTPPPPTIRTKDNMDGVSYLSHYDIITHSHFDT